MASTELTTEDGTAAGGRRMSLEDLLDEGYLIAIPEDYIVLDHPGSGGRPTAYLAAEPLDLGDSQGGRRRLKPGDLLHADEVRHAGTALHGLLGRHQVLPLPADTGIVGALSVVMARVATLERLVASLHGATPGAA